MASPAEVVSMRDFFRLSKAWPDDLPSCDGNAVIVAGLEGCLDALDEAEAELWLSGRLRQVVLSFQDYYQGAAAVVFWLPTGRKRIDPSLATERYSLRGPSGRGDAVLAIGACLIGGAEVDVARIVESSETSPDPDGSAWVGLHHLRIS